MWKRLWEWIKRPHGLALIPFYMLTAGCVAGAIVFTALHSHDGYEIAAYVFYALAAVTFGYTVYTLVIFIPAIKRKASYKLRTNRFTAKVFADYDAKTKAFALLSFAVTVAFAIMNLVSACMYKLVWYGAISAYYFVLIFFRGGVLFANYKCAKKFADDESKYEECKWRIYLASGAFLILVEGAMVGAITQLILSGRPEHGGEIMAISNAAYTFYKIVMAIYNLVKARKSSNPVTHSLRNLNFADACMSAVSLTVLMISTFEATETIEMQYVKCVVGFAVCAIIIAMAAYMIIKSSNKLKTMATPEGENENER